MISNYYSFQSGIQYCFNKLTLPKNPFCHFYFFPFFFVRLTSSQTSLNESRQRAGTKKKMSVVRHKNCHQHGSAY